MRFQIHKEVNETFMCSWIPLRRLDTNRLSHYFDINNMDMKRHMLNLNVFFDIHIDLSRGKK
jgi:hypothetical protein